MTLPRVSIQTEDFDLSTEVARLRLQDKRVGAVCSFIGTVRDRNDGQSVSTMELEHYPGMTERAIEAMIDEALRRFDIRAARVVHRVGPLAAGISMAVAGAGPDPRDAIAAFVRTYTATAARLRTLATDSGDDKLVRRFGGGRPPAEAHRAIEVRGGAQPAAHRLRRLRQAVPVLAHRLALALGVSLHMQRPAQCRSAHAHQVLADASAARPTAGRLC